MAESFVPKNLESERTQVNIIKQNIESASDSPEVTERRKLAEDIKKRIEGNGNISRGLKSGLDNALLNSPGMKPDLKKSIINDLTSGNNMNVVNVKNTIESGNRIGIHVLRQAAMNYFATLG